MLTEPVTTGALDEVRAHIDGWPGTAWVAGRVDPDAIVVLVQRDGRPTVEGHRVLVDAAALDDPAARASAVLETALDLVRDDGPAVPLPEDWAAGLVPDPAAVLWRGDAVAQSAQASLALLHTSVQGCGGMPL